MNCSRIVSDGVFAGEEHPGRSVRDGSALRGGGYHRRGQQVVVASGTADGHETVRSPRPRVRPPTCNNGLLRLWYAGLAENSSENCDASGTRSSARVERKIANMKLGWNMEFCFKKMEREEGYKDVSEVTSE